jgi:prevent-host-death family protein
MKTIGAYEAKTRLSRFLDEVAEGETMTITKHGTPVAQLVPAKQGLREDADRFMHEKVCPSEK